jgi:GTP-binding protein
MSRLPVVAVVGRPNIGKSTLVNRVVGRREAVVESEPGVTRDRREFEAEWVGHRFVMIDTGGWQTKGDQLTEDISDQAEAAIAAADVVLFVVDATTGISPDDEGVARLLRGADQPVLLTANKVDGQAQEPLLGDLWSLGIGTPHPISALHGRGVGDLLDELVELLPEADTDEVDDDRPRRLAIIGRPNVGKSTLLNRLVGEERVLTSPTPGTTRDPIDVEVVIDEEPYTLIDTAGIRRAPKLTDRPEYFAVQRARKVLADADVAILVLDATEGATQGDQRIAEEAASAGAALIVVLNKWDAIDEDQREWTEDSVADRLAFVGWAPVLRMSAKTGARTHRLGEALAMVLEHRSSRIPTPELNRLVRGWQAAHPIPVRKGRRAKIQYAVQAGTDPPTVVLFASGGDVPEDYLRFLENRLRGTFDFVGTPVHLVARRRQPRR